MSCLTWAVHFVIYFYLGSSSIWAKLSHGKVYEWNTLWWIEFSILVFGLVLQSTLPVCYDPAKKQNTLDNRKSRTLFLLTLPSLIMLVSICLHLLGLNHEIIRIAIDNGTDAEEHECPEVTASVWIQKQAIVWPLTFAYPFYHFFRYRYEIRSLFQDTFCWYGQRLLSAIEWFTVDSLEFITETKEIIACTDETMQSWLIVIYKNV